MFFDKTNTLAFNSMARVGVLRGVFLGVFKVFLAVYRCKSCVM